MPRHTSVTNPDLLDMKLPAAFFYILGAIRRFRKLQLSDVKKIICEIGIIGITGINYANPERRYTLRTVPDEYFTGLQLLCLMYTGFKLIDPKIDIGVDFQESYDEALRFIDKYG